MPGDRPIISNHKEVRLEDLGLPILSHRTNTIFKKKINKRMGIVQWQRLLSVRKALHSVLQYQEEIRYKRNVDSLMPKCLLI